MAYTSDSKPLELTELTSLATDDTIIVGDTSDTSEVVKYITKTNLLSDFGATFAPLSHTHATTDITSGTFADARIAESNVTQHQAALSITESQISDLGTYLTASNISDAIYGVGWNGDTTNAPSKNAVYDKIETLQVKPAEGAFADGDKTKLDGIETGADVTDTTNVTAAGALMDSELTSITDVKALDQSVVSGASPTFSTANMTDATNKRFMTDAQETNLDNQSGTNTGDEAAASTTVAGVAELATVAEVDTGTDTGRTITPDALAGANIGIRYVQIRVFEAATDTATGDGKATFKVPSGLDGMNLISVDAEVDTAGTTGTTDIQIHNVDNALDMLSTKLTIDSAETGSDTAATPAVINTSNDHINTNDIIRIDVDAVSTTAAKGLLITLGFQLP